MVRRGAGAAEDDNRVLGDRRSKGVSLLPLQPGGEAVGDGGAELRGNVGRPDDSAVVPADGEEFDSLKDGVDEGVKPGSAS